MEAELGALGYGDVRSLGAGGGGCISSGQAYSTDRGKVFVKVNHKPGALVMFEGEMASLDAMLKTNTVAAPKPLQVMKRVDGGGALVMEYIDFSSLRRHAAALGTQLARMHLHNIERGARQKQTEGSVHQSGRDDVEYVEQFGFPVPTSCGFIPQDNTWTNDWLTFYTRNKLGQQLEMIDKEYNDGEARSLWGELQLGIGKLFKGVEVKPSLLHGDLWSGNAAETDQGPVIFDAASFYGHHEYDLGIAAMFGGFSRDFHNAYHALLPKASGHNERNQLYQLFHYLNHWNHFGGGYRSQSIGIMKTLTKLCRT